MYQEEIRKQRKAKLLEMIKANEDLDIETIKAQFSTQTGLRIAKVDEYVRELKAAGLI